MEILSPDFRFDASFLEDKFKNIAGELTKKEFDRELLRKRFIAEDVRVQKLKPETPKNISFLSVDSAIVKKELRYHAIWGSHPVVLYSEFDGSRHPDPLAQGEIGYVNLMYNSFPDIGVFLPYRHIDSRMNSLRIMGEYASLMDSYRCMDSGSVDYFLVDGSLQTNLARLKNEAKISGFPEHKAALRLHKELMGMGKVIGLVEDSHSSDLARRMGFEVPNIVLLDMVLDDCEYVSEKKDGVNICHLKLPSKPLNYIHSRKSNPLVVRWEFSYDDFRQDLAVIAGLWLMEDDILHTQIYPMRLTDYLTRRLKIGGVLDALIAENDVDPLYRNMREG